MFLTYLRRELRRRMRSASFIASGRPTARRGAGRSRLRRYRWWRGRLKAY